MQIANALSGIVITFEALKGLNLLRLSVIMKKLSPLENHSSLDHSNVPKSRSKIPGPGNEPDGGSGVHCTSSPCRIVQPLVFLHSTERVKLYHEQR